MKTLLEKGGGRGEELVNPGLCRSSIIVKKIDFLNFYKIFAFIVILGVPTQFLGRSKRAEDQQSTNH